MAYRDKIAKLTPYVRTYFLVTMNHKHPDINTVISHVKHVVYLHDLYDFLLIISIFRGSSSLVSIHYLILF